MPSQPRPPGTGGRGLPGWSVHKLWRVSCPASHLKDENARKWRDRLGPRFMSYTHGEKRGSCEITCSLTIPSVFVHACPCPSIPRSDRTGQGTHIARPSREEAGRSEKKREDWAHLRFALPFDHLPSQPRSCAEGAPGEHAPGGGEHESLRRLRQPQVTAAPKVQGNLG